ncbi:hypothetical protein BH24ACT1_BH24ACT1_05760 [soil metagenome]
MTEVPREDKHTRSEPLDLGEDEDDVVIEQQNVGRPNVAGSGEFPDPDTPPSDASPEGISPGPRTE